MTIVIIIVSRKFIKVLAKAIENDISSEIILNILGLNTMIAVNAFLPVSAFIAIIIVLGKMYRNQEMVAIASAGIGLTAIYRTVYLLILPVTIIATVASMLATPWAEAKINSLVHDSKHMASIKGITAGKFSEYSHGDLILYTETIVADKMYKVFVQSRNGNKLNIVNAKQGHIEYRSGDMYLVLEQGKRIKGVPGEMKFTIERFEKYAIRIQKQTTSLKQKREGVPTTKLWSSYTLLNQAELHDRMSIPLAILLLSFVAVPLAKLNPRGGVYGNVLTSLAIYFIFENLKRVVQKWVISGEIQPALGFVGIHLMLFLVGIALLVHFYGSKWIFLKITKITRWRM